MHEAGQKQTASAVLMIRPVRFQSNPLTAESNPFQQQHAEVDPAKSQADAAKEFDGLVAALVEAGVEVCVFDDTVEPHTPDSIFPNNWLTLHSNGSAVLYPMMASNRHQERRPDLVEKLSQEHGFRVDQVIDLGADKHDGRALEGTGSMVLDRVNRIAYACMSPRTDPELLAEFGQRLGYESVAFDAFDENGVAIYHTNVLMCVGRKFVAICSAAIPQDQREAVLDRIRASDHEIVDISFAQMTSFAGNMLELENKNGDAVIAMSAQAWSSLDETQRDVLTAYARIVTAPIDSIEASAGGSVRCMLAEIHLPRKQTAGESER